ncbi:MAG: choice-of-anchor D domain-containing protein [Pseudomonadota bacterium]
MCIRSVVRSVLLSFTVVLGMLQLPVQAQSILNPHFSDPIWKLWYEDDATVVNGATTLSPPTYTNWLFPDDADTLINSDAFLEYRGTDWPQRKYAGFWYDVYSSRDGAHSYIRTQWSDTQGNLVRLRSPDAIMHLVGGSLTALGVTSTSQSTTGQGHNLTDSFNDINNLERQFYFANALKGAPAHISYIDRELFYSDDIYDALVPIFYNSIGSSGSETMALTKLTAAGGYLPRTVKPELLKHGLLQPAMLYLWKAGLPYKVPYEHELRHRVAYISYGDGSNQDYSGSNRSIVAPISYRYDPQLHMRNMVAMAKQMDVVPPITLVKGIETLQGTEKSLNKTAIRVWQAAGETAQIRVSVEDSYDLQGLPLSFRWKILNGNKNTTVVHEGGSTYLITVPPDDNLPSGRTVVMLTANNGFYDSNPATVNIYRTDGAVKNNRVRPITGMSDVAILPGERVSYTLVSRDSEGYPITYSQWDGVGDIDGNIFTWDSPLDAAPGDYPVRIVASDGTNGNGYGSGEATIEVTETVAGIDADVVSGVAPLTVNFSSANSRDAGAYVLDTTWDFNDGNSSTTANTAHTFTLPGFYEVSLTVSGPLGSHTDTRVIEVRHDWALALNNGWDASTGIDPAVWTGSGTDVVADSYGWRLRLSGGSNDTPVGISSVQTLTTPMYVESVFHRPFHGTAKKTGFDILGSLIGHPDVTEKVLQEKDMSIGHPSDTSPGSWDSQFIGPAMRIPRAASELRMYVDDDPNNPGKIRYSGYVESDLGRYFFTFDNQDPAESWFNNRVGVNSHDSGFFDLWRLQVWTPTGDVSGPEVHVAGSEGQNVYNKLFGTSELFKDTIKVDSATEFGAPANIGGSVVRTYTVKNLGDTTLNMTGAFPHVTMSGTNAVDFVVTGAPAASIAPGASTSFDVTFTPGGSGVRLASINIPTDDADEPEVHIHVRGWGSTDREINVEGNGANITAGDAVPNATDHTDFGTVDRQNQLTRSFTIQNTGLQSLALNGVTVTGAGAGDFIVTKSPRMVLNGGESTRFEITFNPGAIGLRTATVTVDNDDTDESAYSFTIQGRGTDRIVTSVSEVLVAEGGSASFAVKLSNVPAAPVMVTVTAVTNAHLDDDISVTSSATLNFDGGNWDTLQTVDLAAAEDATNTVDGYTVIHLSADSSDFTTAFVGAREVDNDLNAQPVAVAQDVTVDEDCTVDITLKGRDGDTGSVLSFSIAANPLQGMLTGTAPTVSYTPGLDYSGADSFSFIVNDGLLDSAVGLVSIDVLEIDDALDSDGDGLTDQVEKCVYGTKPDRADTDFDGLNDGDEINVHNTDPLNRDTDGDLMLDGWEVTNGLDPQADDSAGDLDGDGLTNLEEQTNQTDPNAVDTDGDGLGDGDEVNIHGTNPARADTDRDGLTDSEEINIHGTNPTVKDTEGDGMWDGWEIENSLDPLVDDSAADEDGDGLSNGGEFDYETDPNDTDTDGDSLSDGAEVNTHGTSPTLTDTDNDRLSDAEELQIYGTDPLSALDSDGDKMPDDWENVLGLNAADDSDGGSDSDGDGVINYLEFWRDNDPLDPASVPVLSEVYVDQNTCDPDADPDGSQANPFCTIQNGITAAQGGDTVWVAGGVYTTSIFVNLDVGKPIILQALPGPRVVYSSFLGKIDMHGIAWGRISGIDTSGTWGVQIRNVRNVVYEDSRVIDQWYPNINMTISGQDIQLSNVLVETDTAQSANLGISIANDATNVNLTNVTIGGDGTAMTIGAAASVNITDSIMWVTGAQTFTLGMDAQLNISHSITSDMSYAGNNANLFADPLFVDVAAMDYHLSAGSLAIDGGNTASAYANEPEPNACRVNMGAFGNTAEAAVSTDDPDNDGLFGYCEVLANTDPNHPDTDHDGINDSNEVTAGTDPLDLFNPNGEGWNLATDSVFAQQGSVYAAGDTLHILGWSNVVGGSANNAKYTIEGGGNILTGSLTNLGGSMYSASVPLAGLAYTGSDVVVTFRLQDKKLKYLPAPRVITVTP